MTEFPIERGKTKRCPKCYKIFENASVSTVIGHVGAFHDEVVKYALDMLDLPSTDKVKIPIDDFDDGSVGVPMEVEASFLYKCDLCSTTCNTRSDLKLHYLDHHYSGKFQEEFPRPFCQFCEHSVYQCYIDT